ncbi:MAG: DHA2 family efflux MFS transporter permease subunit [Rhodospirillaceae bacterium]|nr:DHA2 family efflux MFS transporter permease subunit [Rhodospirillaceae bacterium]MDD9928491.1 DHA2 family efflux MFS transporter permease subunit [Rhodospirillaceae bacterium]
MTATRPIPRGLILLAVSMCTMLYAVTMTIVNVVLPQLQGALSATPEQVSWVVTLNVIATAVVTPATGWMVARWGHRRVIIWSIVGFSISSLLCAIADSLVPLLIYRVGQGAFGAPLVPLSQAIIVAVYPPERRAFAQGVFGLSVVIGPAIAPALGGYLAEAYNWRFVFILILPMCAATLVAAWLWVHDSSSRSTMRLDWTGFLLFSVAITCGQLIMDRGEREDWLESYEIWAYLALITVSLWLFLVHTATTDNPFINPQLFKDRNFSIGLFLVFVYGMLNITPTVMIPTMLQNLMGYPDSMIGILLAARGFGMALGFFVVAIIAKWDPRIGMIIGISAIGLSGWNMALFTLEVDPWTVAWNGILQGIGSAILWVPLSIVAFATLPVRLLPDASSIFHLLRNFGSSIFISVSVLTVSRTGKISYSELSEHITDFADVLRFQQVMGRWSFDTVEGLAALGSEVNRQALMVGYSNSFALYALVSFAAIPLMLLVKIKQEKVA